MTVDAQALKERTPETFVGALYGLLRADRGGPDRGALAALRRGLGRPPGHATEAYRHVFPYLPDRGASEEDCLLIAPLFAYWHQGGGRANAEPPKDPPRDLGASLLQLATRRPDARSGIERRFVALLNCGRDALPWHLRHAIALLRGGDVPVDWARLLWDVHSWDAPNRSVQRAWARSFWRGVNTDAAPDAADRTPEDPGPEDPDGHENT